MMGTDSDQAASERPEALATAIGLYVLGEVSLGKAAAIAGVSRWEMREILTENGVDLRLGPQSDAELEAEVEAALDPA